VSHEPRIRNTARALLITPAREILLVRFGVAALGRHFWITPGGGIEPGESEREAVAREISEETGLAAAAIGPAVWTRSVPISWAEPPFTQRETYFWVPTPRFEPSAESIPTEAERREIEAYRWWTLAEIEASRERFAPRRIGELLRAIFERGVPPAPIDTED
jgi:8-oxo-dGTP pyrophosphatase MutT (NUDIX family)